MQSHSMPAAGLKKIMVTGAAGAAAVLLAAGCGSSSANHTAAGSLSPIQAIALAASQAKTVNSAAFTIDVQATGAATETMAGSVQLRLRPSLLASVDFSTMTVGGQSLPGGIQEILTSQAAYMKISIFQRELGKPWIRMPYSELRLATGVNFAQFAQQIQNDNPMMQTEMLAGAKNVKVIGTQTIDGVKTTEYSGTYTVAAALAKIPSSYRSVVERQAKMMGATSERFKVWIDAQHQVRKLIGVVNGTSLQTTVSTQVTGINEPVSVSYPPASQVATLPASALQG